MWELESVWFAPVYSEKLDEMQETLIFLPLFILY